MSKITDYIKKINNKESLSAMESYSAFISIMSGDCIDDDISKFLLGLKNKGESVDEIVGAVRAIRGKMTAIKVPDGTIDIVGTGGDGKGTLNISTASALVTAGAGIKVAKHGNKNISSKSGAANILEALGINIMMDPKIAKQSLDQIGICFMMAPLYHPAMKNVICLLYTSPSPRDS